MAFSFIRKLSVKCGLAEGCCWSETDQVFYWVDIIEPCIYRYCLETEVLDSFIPPHNPVNIMLTDQENTLLVTLFDGLYLFNLIEESWKLWLAVEPNKANRLNDGTVDCNGNIWTGSVTLTPDKNGVHVEMGFSGNLFKINSQKQTNIAIEDIGIFNLSTFSPDNKIFYYADSLRSEIYACGYNSSTAQLSAPKLLSKLEEKYGDPDGGTVDSVGNIYSARWDGNGIVKLSTEGNFLDFIPISTSLVTNLCFGGKDLKTVLVTTASLGKEDEDAGKIQLFSSNIAGVLPNRVLISSN